MTPWTAACQVSLSFINSQSLLKLMCIESVMPSNHLILCRPLNKLLHVIITFPPQALHALVPLHRHQHARTPTLHLVNSSCSSRDCSSDHLCPSASGLLPLHPVFQLLGHFCNYTSPALSKTTVYSLAPQSGTSGAASNVANE